MSQIVEKCHISQCCRILQTISVSGSRCEWLAKFNYFFFVHTSVVKFSWRFGQ